MVNYSMFVALSMLVLSCVEARYAGTARNELPQLSLEQDAVRMATPQKQRDMNALLRQHRLLANEKTRLEADARIVNQNRDQAVAAVVETGRKLLQVERACRESSDMSTSVCRSIARKQQEYVSAKLRLAKAKQACEENRIGYGVATRKLDHVNNDLQSVRNFFPRPSNIACPDNSCHIICKYGKCYCVCP